jgi:hypothetical protein
VRRKPGSLRAEQVRVSVLGTSCCSVSYRCLTTLSKKCWDRLTRISLDNLDVTLANTSFENALGQGRFSSASATDCLSFLRVFLDENAQPYPNSHLKYLTTMWPVSQVYLFYTRNTAPPFVSEKYMRRLWLRHFPDYHLAKVKKRDFSRCAKCDLIGLAYKGATNDQERRASMLPFY